MNSKSRRRKTEGKTSELRLENYQELELLGLVFFVFLHHNDHRDYSTDINYMYY